MSIDVGLNVLIVVGEGGGIVDLTRFVVEVEPVGRVLCGAHSVDGRKPWIANGGWRETNI